MKYTNVPETDVVIIGGGAAGLMAAITAALRGLTVCVVEKNRVLGKKIRITGKGRCNVTNACDLRTILENVPQNGKFLYSALSAFSPEDTVSFFESIGLPMKIERGNRVFPQSDLASSVVHALENYACTLGVTFRVGNVKKITTHDGRVTGVLVENETLDCKGVILATGGLSYPRTGSTGDGYRMAKALGHTVMPLRPSLVPLESSDPYCAEMQGFSLKNVKLTAYEEEKRIYEEQGEMLFTHFGVSGPLVLSASAHMRHMGEKTYRLCIDLKPALDEKKLDTRILRDFEKYHNRAFKNALGDLAGRMMIPVLIALSGIPEETKVNTITKEQRKRLVSLFKAFPVTISAMRPIAEAIVTSGGICVQEVDPKTMESKLISGLHFAGEVLDVDAYTGGFNLQIAWSTGYQAGNHVCS